MTVNTENSDMGNFSIQDTMTMGRGSTELLNDLLSPETTTGNSDNLESIIKEVDEEITEKVITKIDKSDDKKAGDKKPETSIQDFLAQGDEEEDEEEEEEVITDKKVKTTPEEENEEEETSGNNTTFSTLAKELVNLGVFTEQEEGEEAITTPEQFLEKFQSEKQSGAIEMVNNFIGQFGEDYQEAFNSIFVKGVNPKEYFNTFNKVSDFTNIDLTQEDNQKLVLRQALTDQGFEGEDINLEIERLINYGDLEVTAQRHHKVLVKRETQTLKDLETKAQSDLQSKTAIKNTYIQNVQSILQDKVKEKSFDGIPLNPKLANELHDFLLVDKYKTPSGETLTDFDRTILDLKKPENHATKVKIGLLLKILEKDPTLSTIQKTGVTKKTNQLFSEVVRQVSMPTKTNIKKDAPTLSWFTK